MRAAAPTYPLISLLRFSRLASILSTTFSSSSPLTSPLTTSPISSHRVEVEEAAEAEAKQEEGGESETNPPKTAAEVFLRWGCTSSELSQILSRHPSLSRLKPPFLHPKLLALRSIVGISSSDLVKIIARRPRFLSTRLYPSLLLPRLSFFRSTLFPSSADHNLLLRAVSRNPSLLTYDIDKTLLPCVRLYASHGVDAQTLGRLLVSRPTIVIRSSLDSEKLDLLRRTRLLPSHPMYKYALSILAVSRPETIRAKIANLEKFGFSSDEVLTLFARTPNILTLSIDKVQRNMTFVLGTMKLPASVVLDEPMLLYCNLDKVLRPRHLVDVRVREMGLRPQIKEDFSMVKVIRMREPRFLRAFVQCHEEDAAAELMEYYNKVKGLRRLAESSRSTKHKGFPF
ncbi:uncharacterized protein [Typha angustifolia]|uniref:uncharacterized protein n=1 Tax=Typha angustifolia TaxID=59011 RepID=UPI003C2FB0C7